MGQIPLKPRYVIRFLIAACSGIGTVVFLLVYPPIRHRFDPTEYPIFAGMMLLFITISMVAIGMKFFGNVEAFQQTALAKFFAGPHFTFGIVPFVAAAITLITRSWILFVVIVTIGGVLRTLSRKANVRLPETRGK